VLKKFFSMFSDKNIIGLDIGSDSIKMVEVTFEGDIPTINTFGIAKHNMALDGYWDSSRLRQISTVVEEIMDAANFEGIKTIMSIQSKDVFVTTMDFEASWNKKIIQNEIDKQAPYFLPYPPDETRLSWELIENDPSILEYTGKQRVIINALPDFVIENSKNLLEHVNLDGVALENQTKSQIRACLEPDVGNTVLVDVGSTHTTFSIIVEGILRSSSHSKIGSEKITLDFAEQLGLDNLIAEYFKKDLNLVNLYNLPAPILDNLKILETELRTFVELNKKIAQIPAKIIFTGGGIYTPGFMEYFQGFGIPVYQANCLRSIRVRPELIPYISPNLNQLSTAIGLCLKKDV